MSRTGWGHAGVWSAAAMGVAAAALLAGCGAARDGTHSVVNPASVEGGQVESLWWLYLWICTAVYVLVMAAVLWGIARTRRRSRLMGDQPEHAPEPRRERRAGVIISTAVGITVVLLMVMLAGELVTGHTLYALEQQPVPLEVRITGHQWWWDVEYPYGAGDSTDGPAAQVRTSNVLHIPTGRPVRIQLQSMDVIHSFWIPSLNGKKDLIPGHAAQTWIHADQPGVYTGQCAEYCGEQHAHMRLEVVAEPEDQFRGWIDAQHAPAAEPQTDAQRRGQHVFTSGTCVMCHTITGTIAQSRVGPDLTHLASRPTIAANTAPNVRGYLAGWLLDPQHIKPGVRMPNQALPPEDFHALLDYLESLK